MSHHFVFHKNTWKFIAKDAIVSSHFPKWVSVPMQYLWKHGPTNQYVLAVSYYDYPNEFQVGLTGTRSKGEGFVQSALRELEEEVGLVTDQRYLKEKYHDKDKVGYILNAKHTKPSEFFPEENNRSDLKGQKIGIVVYGTLDDFTSRLTRLTGNDGIVHMALLPVGIHR